MVDELRGQSGMFGRLGLLVCAQRSLGDGAEVRDEHVLEVDDVGGRTTAPVPLTHPEIGKPCVVEDVEHTIEGMRDDEFGVVAVLDPALPDLPREPVLGAASGDQPVDLLVEEEDRGDEAPRVGFEDARRLLEVVAHGGEVDMRQHRDHEDAIEAVVLERKAEARPVQFTVGVVRLADDVDEVEPEVRSPFADVLLRPFDGLGVRVETEVPLVIGQPSRQVQSHAPVAAAEIEDARVGREGAILHDDVRVVRSDVGLGASVEPALKALRRDRVVGFRLARAGGEAGCEVEECTGDRGRCGVGCRHDLTLAAGWSGQSLAKLVAMSAPPCGPGGKAVDDTSSIEGQAGTLPGGHVLPLRFAAVSVEAPRARKRRPGLVFGLVGAIVVIATITTLQLTANGSYDTAEEQFRDAARTTADARLTLDEANADLGDTADSASLLLASDTGILVDPAAKEGLTAAVANAADATSSADALLTERVPDIAEKPTWFWELYAGAGALDEDRRTVERLDAQLQDEIEAIDTAGSTLTESGVTLLTTTAGAAAAHEAAHISARNDDVIALRKAAATASAIAKIDSGAVTAFGTLQSAASQLVASEDAELAEKSGPLMGARLEIEAFARSIAPGVLLDFDWAPIVNGVGYNGSMGGYTTWWWDDPGRATIQLSNSVAEQWPADRSKALVVHEVGHAISVKCADMYDASTQDSIEKWATAWAISMGYTDDANGVWAYGYPPQNYIDAAAGCR